MSSQCTARTVRLPTSGHLFISPRDAGICVTLPLVRHWKHLSQESVSRLSMTLRGTGSPESVVLSDPIEALKPYERKVNIEVVQSPEQSEQSEGLRALAEPVQRSILMAESLSGSYDSSAQPDEEYRSAHQNRHTSV